MADYGKKGGAPAAKSSDSLLKEIREAFDYDSSEWKPIQDEGKTDVLCVAGKVWQAMDPNGMAARDKAKRPMINADEINQYINQAVNGVRANPRAVKFSPVGGEADETGAEFYADKWREIEYRSKAQIAYTTAFQNAVERGYGFVRLKTKYSTTPNQRFNQDIWIEAVPNPDLVLPDSDAQSPDSSDMTRCFVVEAWPIREFERRFGAKSKLKQFTLEHQKVAPRWVKDSQVLVAEYWKVKTSETPLLLVQRAPQAGPQVGPLGLNQSQPQVFDCFEHEYAELQREGDVILDRRQGEHREVCQYLTNGVEVIEETEWVGKYIPIASCYGKVLYVDEGGGAKRHLISMTRLARDPLMLYCYYRTTQAELVGMTPKTPYMAYEGQLDNNQLEAITKSLHEPVPVILAKATIEGLAPGTVLPLPMRQPYRPEIELLEIGAEAARRAIQAAMATNFLPTQAQRRNEKSGRALEKMDETAQRGSFHFNDHYDGLISHTGVMGEDLLDKIYDTDREVGIRKKNDQSVVVRINAPSQDENKKPIFIRTKGDYQVTVSTGPAFDSTREAVSQFADLLMETPFAPLIADLAVKLKSGSAVEVTMEEIADRLTPPQFKKQKDGQPDPQQLLQMLQKMGQEHEQLKQVTSELAMTIKSKRLEIESNERIARADIESKERIAGNKTGADLTKEFMKLGAQESIAMLEAKLEEARAMVEGHEADLQRHHEFSLSAEQHQQAMQQSEASHRQKLEQGEQAFKGQMVAGEQSHVNALEQGQAGHSQALEQIKATPKPKANGSGA